jgi:hypothetical protein
MMATDTYVRVIVDHRTDGSEAKQPFITNRTGIKRRRKDRRFSYKKDGSAAWDTLEDMKKSYLLQLADYLLSTRFRTGSQASGEPTFTWRIRQVLRKRN